MRLKANEYEHKIEYVKTQLADNLRGSSEYYRFGVEKFGPFLYGYTMWLHHEIKKESFSKVFFFARDGYMMQKAFQILDDELDTQYVYFSRKSIRQALLYKCSSYKESLKYLTWERFITIGKLLEYYGFSMKEREEIADQENLDLEENLSYADLISNSKMEELYGKIREKIAVNSKHQDKMLRGYLNQINMKDRCAIVDIGWHGNMQFYLDEYFKHIGLKVELYGYYVGIEPTPELKSKNFGWLYSDENSELRKDVLCFFGVYEKLFQSTEGSTYGYEMIGESVAPVLADYEYSNDKQMVERIGDWQSGALDFVQIASQKNMEIDDNRAWAYPLIEVGKKPSNADVKLLSFLYNTDGTKIYFVSQKPLYKYKPKELIFALSNSAWKTGFMKSVFKLPLPYYYIYRALRK